MQVLAAYRKVFSGSSKQHLALAFAILSLSLFAERPMAAATVQSVESRLQALEDRKDIEDLILGTYSHLIDTSDIAALSELFTEDGEYSSEWRDISSMPPPLRNIFIDAKIPKLEEKSHFKVTFRGRKTIENFMSMVANERPVFTFRNGTAVATFDATTSPDVSRARREHSNNDEKPRPAGMPDDHTIPPMKHLVTNPRITVNGDLANATSYWTEISTGGTGTKIVAGGGYYTDVLERVGNNWRIRQRIIHNYDEN